MRCGHLVFVNLHIKCAKKCLQNYKKDIDKAYICLL